MLSQRFWANPRSLRQANGDIFVATYLYRLDSGVFVQSSFLELSAPVINRHESMVLPKLFDNGLAFA